VAIPDGGAVRLTGDLIVFEPPDPFLVYFCGQSQMTIHLLGHSIFFDGQRVVFRTNLGIQSAIGLDGTFCTEKAGTLMIVQGDGQVSKRRNGKWSTFDSNGNVTENGRRENGVIFFSRDFTTNRRRMIRSDHIEYSVCSDGTRMIFHQDDFSIVQYSDSIAYDLPNFPLATWQDGVISLAVGPVTFTCGDGVSGAGDDLALGFRNGLLSVRFRGRSIVAAADSLKVTGESYRVTGDRSGAQCFEASEAYRPTDILKLTQPRLFAVRNDLSLVEFVREEEQRFDGAELRASRVPGHRLSIVTAHFADEAKDPLAAIEFTPQTKQERDALIATVEAASAEAEADFEAAVEAKDGYLEAVATLDELVRGCLMREHGMFLSSKGSRSLLDLAMGKQFQPPVPVSPRRQEAKFFRGEPKVGDLRPGQVLNYWACRESAFDAPETDDC
jgi:hypothetical protein